MKARTSMEIVVRMEKEAKRLNVDADFKEQCEKFARMMKGQMKSKMIGIEKKRGIYHDVIKDMERAENAKINRIPQHIRAAA